MSDPATPENLPQWDLGDLYAAPDAPEIELDLARGESLSKGFAAAYQGQLVGLNGDDLGQAIADYEIITGRRL